MSTSPQLQTALAGMGANATASAPKARKKLAQGKEPSDAALGYGSLIPSSPEGAKENGQLPKGWRWLTLRGIAEISGGNDDLLRNFFQANLRFDSVAGEIVMRLSDVKRELLQLVHGSPLPVRPRQRYDTC